MFGWLRESGLQPVISDVYLPSPFLPGTVTPLVHLSACNLFPSWEALDTSLLDTKRHKFWLAGWFEFCSVPSRLGQMTSTLASLSLFVCLKESY